MFRLENKGFACDELIMNTLVTLNNLTFYNSNAVIQSAVKLIDGKRRIRYPYSEQKSKYGYANLFAII